MLFIGYSRIIIEYSSGSFSLKLQNDRPLKFQYKRVSWYILFWAIHPLKSCLLTSSVFFLTPQSNISSSIKSSILTAHATFDSILSFSTEDHARTWKGDEPNSSSSDNDPRTARESPRMSSKIFSHMCSLSFASEFYSISWI